MTRGDQRIYATVLVLVVVAIVFSIVPDPLAKAPPPPPPPTTNVPILTPSQKPPPAPPAPPEPNEKLAYAVMGVGIALALAWEYAKWIRRSVDDLTRPRGDEPFPTRAALVFALGAAVPAGAPLAALAAWASIQLAPGATSPLPFVPAPALAGATTFVIASALVALGAWAWLDAVRLRRDEHPE